MPSVGHWAQKMTCDCVHNSLASMAPASRGLSAGTPVATASVPFAAPWPTPTTLPAETALLSDTQSEEQYPLGNLGRWAWHVTIGLLFWDPSDTALQAYDWCMATWVPAVENRGCAVCEIPQGGKRHTLAGARGCPFHSSSHMKCRQSWASLGCAHLKKVRPGLAAELEIITRHG